MPFTAASHSPTPHGSRAGPRLLLFPLTSSVVWTVLHASALCHLNCFTPVSKLPWKDGKLDRELPILSVLLLPNVNQAFHEQLPNLFHGTRRPMSLLLWAPWHLAHSLVVGLLKFNNILFLVLFCFVCFYRKTISTDPNWRRTDYRTKFLSFKMSATHFCFWQLRNKSQPYRPAVNNQNTRQNIWGKSFQAQTMGRCRTEWPKRRETMVNTGANIKQQLPFFPS